MRSSRRALVVVTSAVLLAAVLPFGGLGVAFGAGTPVTAAPGPTTPGPTDPGTTAPETTPPQPTVPDSTIPVPTAPDGTPAPISEQVAPPEEPLPDPSRHIRVLLAELGVHDAEQTVADAQQALDHGQAAAADANGQVDAAGQVVRDAEDALAAMKSDLASYGAWAYMFAGDGEVMASLQGDLTATERQKQFLAVSIDHQDELVKEGQRHLDDVRQALADRENAATDAAHAVDDATTALDDAHSALRDARQEQFTALANERNDGGDWQLTLEGPSVFHADELAQYFVQQGQESHATVPIDELAGYYIDEGAAEGIRGDMAFAQAILETGSFGNPDTITRNNFAGIGHCGDCDGGFIFDSAQLGVRGQMQLLKSYSSVDAEHANPLVDRRLIGPAGCCQNWNQLAGVWAGDLNYGPRIQSIYQSMLEWLVGVRTGAAPPPAPVAVPAA